jgi:hypothetical protein
MVGAGNGEPGAEHQADSERPKEQRAECGDHDQDRTDDRQPAQAATQVVDAAL